MKSTKDIINEIHKLPFYRTNKDLNDLFRILSPTHQKVIAFIYKKENILMVACKHPLGLQELKRDSSIKMIKDLLKTILIVRPESNLSEISDVKFFVATKYMEKKRRLKELKVIKYEKKPFVEISKGEFKNSIKDAKIHALFEEIRGLILANR